MSNDDGPIESLARELRAATTAEARWEVFTRHDLTEEKLRKLDALNLIWTVGHGDLEGATAVTGWYSTKDEVVALTAEVALVAARFVNEVGSRPKDLGTGGYL